MQGQGRTPNKAARQRTRAPRWLAAALLLNGAAPLAAAAQDLTALPLEQLLSMEVYSASRFRQQASAAPATVTVVSAADIESFGWRTLADVLRSVPGLYVGYDRNYSYLGARSFLRPGDYNTRFLLQIDGQRINDAVYDQAPLGGEFPLDLELVERIEYVPGPGSSIYGANAFFGVINVITKRAQDLAGGRASVTAGQFGERRGAASYAWAEPGGASLLLAASKYNNDGRDLYFAAFDQADNNHGVARGLDYEDGQRFFAKAGAGPFSLQMLRAQRNKGVPTASFEQNFNDARSRTVDTQSYAELGYKGAPAGAGELDARLFWGAYDSVGDYAYGPTLNRDGSASRWWGAELKTVGAPLPGHKLVAGAEYQHDYRLQQYNYDLAPYLEHLGVARHESRFGLYLQDEISLGEDLLLTAGLRYDQHRGRGAVFSPRLALIWQAGAATTLKAMYGSAYREPNSFELYYAYAGPGGQSANPEQNRERIRSGELALLRQLGPDARLSVSVFENDVRDLISQHIDAASGLAYFANSAGAKARGVELAYRRDWRGATLRANYSWQTLRQNGADLSAVNAPAHLAKLNLAVPLWDARWRAGLEAQYVGPRATLLARTGGYWLANLNVFTRRLTPHLDLAVGLYNVFNRAYADPAPAEHAQDSIAQDGRNARLTLKYAF